MCCGDDDENNMMGIRTMIAEIVWRQGQWEWERGAKGDEIMGMVAFWEGEFWIK